MPTAALVFEGGPPTVDPLEQALARLRATATLDTLAALLAVPAFDPVILATNRPELAAAARRLGAAVVATPATATTPATTAALLATASTADPGGADGFDFMAQLRHLCRQAGRAAVVCLGGASAPLFTSDDWTWLAERLEHDGPCVVVNNPQSVDVVGWNPAVALDRVPASVTPNLLGYLLQHEAGLKPILMPNTAAVHFDLDTPTDYLMLAETGRAGPRLAAALAEVDWDRSRVRALAALLRQDRTGRRPARTQRTDRPDVTELALVGRVGTAVVDYCNRILRLRLRVFSEERGMKALGRPEQGLVRSLLAAATERMGPAWLFAELATLGDGVVMDTRVAFAHDGRRVSAADRYRSDLGLVAGIRDPYVRELTAAAQAATCPVVLGGHGAVNGGLWLLAEAASGRR